jgi:hypothetical protein
MSFTREFHLRQIMPSDAPLPWITFIAVQSSPFNSVSDTIKRRPEILVVQSTHHGFPLRRCAIKSSRRASAPHCPTPALQVHRGRAWLARSALASGHRSRRVRGRHARGRRRFLPFGRHRRRGGLGARTGVRRAGTSPHAVRLANVPPPAIPSLLTSNWPVSNREAIPLST